MILDFYFQSFCCRSHLSIVVTDCLDDFIYAGIVVGVVSENPQSIVIPKRRLSREESAVSPPAASRLLAGKTGFGMTKVSSFLPRTGYDIAAIRASLLEASMPTNSFLNAAPGTFKQGETRRG